MIRQNKRISGVNKDVRARRAVPQNRKPKTATPLLSDHQLVVLSAAAQLKRGLVAETKARRGQTVWRHDEAGSKDIALVVTDASLSFAFLSPDIVHRIIDGDLPKHLTVTDIGRGLPILWTEQRRMFGMPAE